MSNNCILTDNFTISNMKDVQIDTGNVLGHMFVAPVELGNCRVDVDFSILEFC